jgi:hypothetical protein
MFVLNGRNNVQVGSGSAGCVINWPPGSSFRIRIRGSGTNNYGSTTRVLEVQYGTGSAQWENDR